jgi:hypothetical protein
MPHFTLYLEEQTTIIIAQRLSAVSLRYCRDTMIIFPRFHLFEVEDQPWCPDQVVLLIQTYLTVLWNLPIPFSTNSAAKLAAEVIKEQLRGFREFKFVDLCAGAGGPTPTIAEAINSETGKRQNGLAEFILADLKPCEKEWQKLKNQINLSYITDPVDATSTGWRIDRTSGQKVCWIFNISFHHFDDASARNVLCNVAESADSFMYEYHHWTGITC